MKKRLFIFILCFVCIFNAVSEESVFFDTIETVSKLTRKNVHDINSDNEINCIDYTVMFKYYWDKNCKPGHSMNCQIIRNKNPQNGFHHLFVRVREHSRAAWIYIEPQAKYPNMEMTKYWGMRYEPQYDIYNETYIWKNDCLE